MIPIQTIQEVTEWKNKLYYRDNLIIMKKMPDESIDLIYLDPPFNSNRTYNLLYRNATDYPISEQIETFCDTWAYGIDTIELIEQIREELLTRKHEGTDSTFVEFWLLWTKVLAKTNDKLLTYLVYMTIRLLEMKRLLKSTGSIYLHCDPTASHYIKVIMDGIFGQKNFRNEIIWYYDNGGGRARKWFNKKHDVILWYSKSNTNWTYNIEDTYQV